MNSRKGINLRNRLQKQIFILLLIVLAIMIIYNMVGALRTVSFARRYGTDKVLFIDIENHTQPIVSDIKYENGEIFMPFDMVKEYIDGDIYRTDNETDTAENGKIIITTGDSVIRMRSEDNSAYVNGEPINLNMPLYDTDYLPVSVLEQFYNVSLSYNQDNNTVTLRHTDSPYYTAELKRGTYLLYEPRKLSLRVKRLKKGTPLTFYKTMDAEDSYVLVSTEDGLCGYLPVSAVTEAKESEPQTPQSEPKQLWHCEDGKASIVFDQVTNSSANTDYERIPVYDGVDVVCATWFSFENTDGSLKNLADRGYVDRAHASGIKVWGLLTDNFDGTISHSVLANADTREYVIKQLLAYSALYDLDGINIDFEAVPDTDGELFVQFLRELAPMLHNEGITLSADFFVPKAWTYYYNRGRCAEVLDYVVVMGYDQHYAGSTEAGSNAEISWSEEAITATLAQGVPEDKLILGIPFYTRCWTINNSTGELSQRALGMQAARDFMLEKGAQITWDEQSGQNYAEATDGESTYKCWLEDADSVSRRLDLVNRYDIAGIAAWKNNMETEDIWDIIKAKLKKQ
jgi:spore germination protein YaaH